MSSPFSPLNKAEARRLEKSLANIEMANLPQGERQKRVNKAEEWAKALAYNRKLEWVIRRATQREPPQDEHIVQELFAASTAAEVVQLCEQHFPVELIEISVPDYTMDSPMVCTVETSETQHPLGELLTTHADAFIAAKNHSRFPRSSRKSSRDKQLWFMARFLAGAVCGLTGRTAIDRIPAYRK